ncbi:Crp/Fnr family transcriptional regulator [Bradyrhizobium sp. OAE829]|uniref:Crp/Fnr family transcriptional regulator n=1 Tax=Bradyrhizobium sp. OAE829 TaxID=2663807 RepID=UPI00178B2DCD
MQHPQNFLLSRLPADVLSRLAPDLSIIDLIHGDVLAETHGRVEKVYFPHSGIISSVVETLGGGAIETGMIGKDGEFGAMQALDEKLSLNHVVIQVPGSASVISSDRLREIMDTLPVVRGLLIKYEQFFLAQVQQTAACNAIHTVQARMCKWLVRMHDLAGNDIPLTQEFLAQMMGVRRTSVTTVASELQKSGLISYVRGRIRILDLDLTRQWACHCDADVRSHYRRVFEPDRGDD